MKLEIRGLNKYKEKSEKQKALLKQKATEYLRASVRAVLRDLVLKTPQWSGNTAASWKIQTKSHPADWKPTRLYNPDWEDQKPVRFIGDKEAWKVALELNAAVLKSLRWNTTISIVNESDMALDLATDPDAEEKLRPGNFIAGDVMAVAYVSAKYKLGNNLLGQSLLRSMNYD